MEVPLEIAVDEARQRRERMRELGSGDDVLESLSRFGDAGDLTQPIDAVSEKYKLLPAFLAVRGLVQQHLASYNHFVTTEIVNIMRGNDKIVSDVDPKFFLKFEDIAVLQPQHMEESISSALPIMPHDCRMRDITYSAPIEVTVRYSRGEEVVVQKGVRIGTIPVMLGSNICQLYNKSHADLAKCNECPLDPGGYFVVKGTEKVILMQEQLSRNRITVDKDAKGGISASCQSSGNSRRSRTTVAMRHGKLYMMHNTLENEGVNLAVVFRALGVETDMEIMQFVGVEAQFVDAMSQTMDDCAQYGIFTAKQALRHVGNRVKTFRAFGGGGQRGGRGGGFSGGGGGMNRASAASGPSADPVSDAANRTTAAIQKKIETARDLLANSLLSHIPVKLYNFADKIVFLGQMTRRVLLAFGDASKLDDKDYIGNKRIELPGELIGMLFTDLFNKFCFDLKKAIDSAIQKEQTQAGKSLRKAGHVEQAAQVRSKHRSSVDVTRCFRTDTITQGIEFAITTGNWSLKAGERGGVTEVLSRLSFIAALGMMTRVTSQFEKTRKVSGPRALQPSQWGMLCPSDTPEGEACGLVKNLALMAHVTTGNDDAPLGRLLYDLGIQSTSYLSGMEINENHLVYLNGIILGVHSLPSMLCYRLRYLRRHGLIGEFIGVYEDTSQRCVHVSSDAGRLCRPLVIVDEKTGISRMTGGHIARVSSGSLAWRDLINEGIVEYVDVNEQNNCLIATWELEIEVGLTTHLEIAPLTVLGVCAGLIPYPHHNQSPRNTYQCAMGKQAIGAIAYNQHKRTDTLLYLLSYPQRPLVQTKTLALVGFERLPGGQNASLCVMSYSGYDIEDAIVLNKASLDRGFGRCSVTRKSTTGTKRYPNGLADRIMPAAPDVDMGKVVDPNCPGAVSSAVRRSARFTALDDDGMAAPGMRVSSGHIFINKEVPLETTVSAMNAPKAVGQGTTYKPEPLIFKGPVPVVVDRVLVTSNDNYHVLVKTMLRDTRRPELGDKFSSRHGQKGVTGLIASQEDMPFSDKGIVPDLIMNPHGFPSRMTVGKMIEFVAGKAGVFEGKFREGTAFDGDPVEDCAKALVERGYNYNGKDLFYDGTTGEPMRAYVFAGPIFYQKLKHMVQDKMHARSRGPRAVLTRQPTEGRSREGGLRLGEMERDCLISYGASMLLMERLMISSDAFEVHACSTCGLLTHRDWCQSCANGKTVASLRIPYACKLLFQELQAMNVVPRLCLEEA